RLRVDPAFTNAEPVRHELTVDRKTKSRKFTRRDQVAGELAYFADCILTDRSPEPAGEEGLADLRIIEAMHESARTGARVAVRSVDRPVRPSLEQVQKQRAHGRVP